MYRSILRGDVLQQNRTPIAYDNLAGRLNQTNKEARDDGPLPLPKDLALKPHQVLPYSRSRAVLVCAAEPNVKQQRIKLKGHRYGSSCRISERATKGLAIE